MVAIAAARLARPPGDTARWWKLALLCSIVPDFDVAFFLFGVPYESFWGHRGFTHSILFALLAGAAAAAFALRGEPRRAGPMVRTWAFFSAVTVSHPLLDALTNGGFGVALFSPFDDSRYFFPVQPIEVSPIGVRGFFSQEGLAVVLSELPVIYLPCAVILALEAWVRRRRAAAILIGCASASLLGGCLVRQEPAKYSIDLPNPMLEAATGSDGLYTFLPNENLNHPNRIPREWLPPGLSAPETDLGRLTRLGIFNRPIEAKLDHVAWSSGFFPIWFGGVSGKWQESRAVSLWKSIFGDSPLGVLEALDLVHSAATGGEDAKAEIFGLSPTEKYDLAVGDYPFSTTRIENVRRGHDKAASEMPALWSGLCNGAAAAAIHHAEPFRTVRVENPDGYEIVFHPNDVKALLALAYTTDTRGVWALGGRCDGTRREAPLDCFDLNPGTLVVALANVVGLAHHAVSVDKMPGPAVVNVPVVGAQIDLLSPIYHSRERTETFPVSPLVEYLVDIRIRLKAGSTQLDRAPADQLAPDRGEGHYREVGFVDDKLEYEATLGMDASLRILGGRWRTEARPDFLWATPRRHSEPGKRNARLWAEVHARWNAIEAIHAASVSTSKETPRLRIIDVIGDPSPLGINFEVRATDGFRAHFSHLSFRDGFRAFGYVEGEAASRAEVLRLAAGLDPESMDEGKPLGEFPLVAGAQGRRYFRIDASAPAGAAPFLKGEILAREGGVLKRLGRVRARTFP